MSITVEEKQEAMNSDEKQKKSDAQVAGLVSATYLSVAGACGKAAAELIDTPNEFAAPYLGLVALGCLFPAVKTAYEYRDEVPKEFAKGMIVPFLALNLIWGKIEYDHTPDDFFAPRTKEVRNLEIDNN
ncbi:MAG: hypothetical protein KDI90_09950 [Alphaproteobacteria bacterium]|nr:hypothetical protein [Alphaproteobacteria bacterium]MCB9975082.1 hypothetical protein [Rhodospirillales bacterium]